MDHAAAFFKDGRNHPPVPPLVVPNNPALAAKTPSKRRSLSDSTPVLGPSPNLKEPPPRTKDDESVIATPSRAPRRSNDLSARGLIIQMPPRDPYASSIHSITNRGLQSPPREFDAREAYGSPSSVLPRHSRGLDFSRAATHLHHSTLAETTSPDSSPTITQKTFMAPSRRSSVYSSMLLDSPRLNSGSAWSANGERGFFSRSVGSTNAVASDASSSGSDEDDVEMLQDESEDAMVTTPQLRRSAEGSNVTPFAIPTRGTDQSSSGQSNSAGPSAFVQYRRNVLTRRTSRQSRGSLGNRSRTASPDTHAMSGEMRNAGNYTAQELAVRSPPSRRDSLSFGIGAGLHITSSNESGEDNAFGISPMTPGVVRRPVTRRSNMLPKTKNFARIRAALQEESAPVDSEARRESEVVRQVRVNDVGRKDSSAAMPSSPDLTPTVNLSHDSSEMSDIEALSAKGGSEGAKTLPDFRRDSMHKEFLPSLNKRTQTPPPPNFSRHRSSSGVSEDVSMDSPYVSTPPSSIFSGASAAWQDAKADSELASSGAFHPPMLPSAAELTFKANNKRRRDDEFDANSLKRRAVSPGISTHSSPVLGQSPASTSGPWSKQGKSSNSEKSSGGSATEEKGGSSSSTGHATPTFGPKRVGLQGMADTNDGLMSMSIE